MHLDTDPRSPEAARRAMGDAPAVIIYAATPEPWNDRAQRSGSLRWASIRSKTDATGRSSELRR